MISKRPEQVDLPGQRKQTPLHYAALTDNIDAAKILVSHEEVHFTHGIEFENIFRPVIMLVYACQVTLAPIQSM